MRHTSVRHGLLYLTLIFSGGLPTFIAAQDSEPATADTGEPAIVIDMAAPLEPERPAPTALEPDALRVYRSYIETMEASAGAFAPGLTEQLLGLGLNLQALGRHDEAATILKRGVHVSRVQSGLYSADQLPLLRAEIRSLTALGRYDEVDERQRYLARVESEALEGTPASIAALLDQGAWAEQAWDLRLGDEETHPEHLARSWEYYRLAYNQSAQLFGSESMELLKPLEGMVRLQYRFAQFQRANAAGNAFDGVSYRQASALGGVYRRGESVLLAIYGLKLFNKAPAGEQASDLARLGDWARWLGRRSDARDYYDQAWRRITPPPEAVAGAEPETPNNPAPEGDAADAIVASENSVDGAVEQVAAASSSASTTTDEIDSADPPATANQIALTEGEAAAETTNPSESADSEPESTTESNESTLSIAGDETNSVDATTFQEPPPVDDPAMRLALFQTATPLPDIDGLRPLPPFKRDASGPLVVRFQVNEAGKITTLERLSATSLNETEPDQEGLEGEETAEDEDAAATEEMDEDPGADRLLRKLRRVRFRPRYEGGQAVETGMITWSFDLTPSSDEGMALQPQ